MTTGGRRDSTKEKFWRRMVRRQAVSRMSVRAWSHRYGRKESAFYWWRAELARRDAAPQRRKPGRTKSSFAPVHIASALIESSGAEDRIEIVLPGDRRIRVRGPVDRQMLADVLAALEARPC